MNFIKKWLSAPSGEIVQLEGVQTWQVRWLSRKGGGHYDTLPEVEVFTNYKDALHFKQQLEDAFKLIRHTSGTSVTIEKS